MKKYLIALLLITGTIILQPVLAHEGHWDGMGLDEVIEEANLEINRLVEDKLLSDSWSQSSEFNYDLTDGLVEINGKKRWILAFTNPTEKDSAKQTIKIIFTPMGKFVAFEFIPKE